MRRLLVTLAITAVNLLAQWGGELRFCLRQDPKTFNPLMVEDDSSETIRYLTGGVLIRVNRLTQELEPELATS
jgi:peptide/nickel transport system substrate-binding protein